MRHAEAVASFAIRAARPGDMPVLRAVYRRASLSNDSDRAVLLAHPDALEFPDLAVVEGRTRIATANGVPIGFATWRSDGPVVEVEDLFVDPDWTRHGAGRGLLLDLLAIARRLGAGQVEVTANPAAVGFYEKAGFAFTGQAATRFGPAPRMQLDLAESACRPL